MASEVDAAIAGRLVVKTKAAGKGGLWSYSEVLALVVDFAERMVRLENQECRQLAADACWRASEMRDRKRARIMHETAKDIAEAIERRHGK